ncbi:hypothetical protein A4T06_06710 [Salmonella enterica subsp. enterica serovar Minnesota]|nr:hypothetical protein [Salmonella enterica]ECT6489491.1 hypothetical protein [Salmonella enterica subsp. enterica serovar Minnesota]
MPRGAFTMMNQQKIFHWVWIVAVRVRLPLQGRRIIWAFQVVFFRLECHFSGHLQALPRKYSRSFQGRFFLNGMVHHLAQLNTLNWQKSFQD